MSYYWKSTFNCVNCGEEFKASRRDAKYCSAKCRKQVSLERKKLHGIHQSVMSHIKALHSYAENREFSRDAAKALAEIKSLLNFTDSPAAAAPGSGSAAQPLPYTPRQQGTDSISSGKRVTAGSDTSSAVQRGVNWLTNDYHDLCNRLDEFEVAIKYDIQQLRKRVDELEEATDWSEVS